MMGTDPPSLDDPIPGHRHHPFSHPPINPDAPRRIVFT
jgi:hypothetical protein